MKLAIMQPYFMPYIGYFSLIKHSDQFILFDTPQFIRHGWIERNRILKQNGEPLYIKIPLQKHSRETAINKVLINNSENWKDKIVAQLVSYKKHAPNYWKIISLLKEIFEYETTSIVKFNYNSLKKTCEYLSITTPIKIWSKMNIKIDNVNAPDEWALHICRALEADVYYNPIRGISFFDRTKYIKNLIELKFMETEATEYKQFTDQFLPFLSIIDVMMFCDIDEVNKMIDNYKIRN